MTAQTLRARSLKDLAVLARKRGVDGWRSMRKDQLVRALLQMSVRGVTPVSKSPSKKGRSQRADECDPAEWLSSSRGSIGSWAIQSAKSGEPKSANCQTS